MTEVHTTVTRNEWHKVSGGIGLGNEDKRLMEDIEEAKRLAGELAKKAKGIERYIEVGGMAEQAEGIEFQKIWRIPMMEYNLRGGDNWVISQGARHTDGKLDGVVGYAWQKGWVVVVQTVLAER